eukprot:11276712-Alexandrium_andersonii.AAC.1
MNAGIEGVRCRNIENITSFNPQSSNPQSAQSLAIGARGASMKLARQGRNCALASARSGPAPVEPSREKR